MAAVAEPEDRKPGTTGRRDRQSVVLSAARRFIMARPATSAARGGYMRAGLSPAYCPPSMGTVAPVMNDAWSEHSHRTAAATSSGRPMRLIGLSRGELMAPAP